MMLALGRSLTTLYHIQGSLDDYNQAVARGAEAWKSWREVCMSYAQELPLVQRVSKIICQCAYIPFNRYLLLREAASFDRLEML